MPELSDLFLGKLALKNKLISKENLQECLEVQEELDNQEIKKNLGNIMMENGLISETQLHSLLQAQKTSELFLESSLYGQLALKNKLVTKEHLKECLAEQRRNPEEGFLGEIMLNKGFINEQQLAALLKTQNRLKEI